MLLGLQPVAVGAAQGTATASTWQAGANLVADDYGNTRTNCAPVRLVYVHEACKLARPPAVAAAAVRKQCAVLQLRTCTVLHGKSHCGSHPLLCLLGRGRAGVPEAPALDLVLTTRLLCFQGHISVGVCSTCMRVGGR
jgi:hypothetical protein